MKTFKYFLPLFVLFFLTAAQIYSQGTSKSNNEVAISNRHIMLPSASEIIYIIPPNESFKFDTTGLRVSFGLLSETYDATMRFSYRIDIPSDVNILRNSYNVLKHETFKSNDVNVQYFKLNPLYNETLIHWVVFCDNDFFSFYGIVAYDIKHDESLSKDIEESLRSIIVIRNPDVVPESNISATGDFSLLGLKFVQKMSIPMSYFTEDGLPALATQGNKVVMIATPPTSASVNIDISENAISELTAVLRNSVLPNDTLIAICVQPVEFVNNQGVVIEGVLASNPLRNFIGVYSFSRELRVFFAILGICNEDEKEEFFEKILKFKDTVNVTM